MTRQLCLNILYFLNWSDVSCCCGSANKVDSFCSSEAVTSIAAVLFRVDILTPYLVTRYKHISIMTELFSMADLSRVINMTDNTDFISFFYWFWILNSWLFLALSVNIDEGSIIMFNSSYLIQEMVIWIPTWIAGISSVM